jgi:arsenate reductase (glutaredoxin)
MLLSITIRAARHRATCSRWSAIPGSNRTSCPPTRLLLTQLLAHAGLTVRQILREKGTPYHELGLGDPTLSDDVLLEAIGAHPILMNRPLVVTPQGLRLRRPSEMVLDLLARQRGQFIKEDGERVVDDAGRRVASA